MATRTLRNREEFDRRVLGERYLVLEIDQGAKLHLAFHITAGGVLPLEVPATWGTVCFDLAGISMVNFLCNIPRGVEFTYIFTDRKNAGAKQVQVLSRP